MLIGVLCLCFSMEQLGLLRDAGAVCFGQLLGMCDHVSLTLGKKLDCECVHVLGRHPQVLFCSQRSTVSLCISLCRTARWRTRCRIWCAGLKRTAACSGEYARNEICSDWSCAADSERRSQAPDDLKTLIQRSQTQFLEGHSFSSNSWKLLVILNILIIWISCV